MQEVFEKIIEKLEERTSFLSDCTKYGNKDAEQQYSTMMMYEVADLVDDLIEIVKQEAEQYEECYKDCGDCEAYNKEKHHCPKFCKVIKETVKEIEENHNGWISCSDRLPEERDWYLAVFEEIDTGFIGIPYIADYLMGSHTKFTTEDGWIIHNCSDREDESAEYYKNLRCVAWKPLPQPYQPKGDYDENTN